MHCSIIIPTRNRCTSLRRCLTALMAMEFAGTFEIIVIDDGSVDETFEMVQTEFPSVLLFKSQRLTRSTETNSLHSGPAAARNEAIRHATGDIIAFIDDDCLAPPDWLTRHTAYYVDPTVGEVGGPQINSPPDFFDKFDAARNADLYYGSVQRIRYLSGWEGLATSNMSVRRAIIDEVGTFNDAFITGADPDLSRRIVQAGYAMVIDPALQVEHLKRHTLKSYLQMRFRRGAGVILADQQLGTVSLRRFVPLANPKRLLRDWRSFRRLWRGGLGEFSRFVALYVLMRIVSTMGRLYYWRRYHRASMEPMLNDKWWLSAPSPIKMSYLNYAAGNTALDIGAGAGFYGTALQTRGFEVTGVDLMERSDLPYPVVQGALHDLSHIQAADTVLAFDVLEHEPNEAAALRELRRLTKKRLLLSVPNGDRTLLTSYNLTYKHHTDKTHMREYTEAELRGKLELAGFRILIMAHEGPVKASFLAEFVRPKALRVPVRWLLKALQRVKLLHNDRLMADLYVVAEPT